MNNQEPSRFTVLCSKEVKIRLLELVAGKGAMGPEIKQNGAPRVGHVIHTVI